MLPLLALNRYSFKSPPWIKIIFLLYIDIILFYINDLLYSFIVPPVFDVYVDILYMGICVGFQGL
nr:MAG TPA: hypothetical protein [Caudoviricetes sp.]